MMNEKTLSLLGLARRAGKLLVGHDAVLTSVKKRKTKLVILTSDASPRHRKELEAAGYTGGVAVLPADMETAGRALGKRCCICSLEDAGFADAVKKTICEEDIIDGSKV